MNASEVREMLRDKVKAAGTRTAWCAAQRPSISGAMVSHFLLGRIDPPPKILAALGVRRVVTYELTDDGPR